MRMRKKKYLTERLAAVQDMQIPLAVHDPDYRNAAKDPCYLDFAALFGRRAPVHLEIGCGKGQFVCEMAARHPEIDFIAVEVCDDVAVMACEHAKQAGLTNVKFMICGAEYLLKYFPAGSVDRIYLNFSCPFPKNTYANRRLTSAKYLAIYREILAPEGEIHQKTDNMHFFEFSLEQFSAANYRLQNISLDLHNSGFEGNIMTEYEKKFTELGQPIYRLEAIPHYHKKEV